MTAGILTSSPSVCRNAIGAREFTDADAMMAHYAALRERTWRVAPVRVQALVPPAPAPAGPVEPAEIGPVEPSSPQEAPCAHEAPLEDLGPVTPRSVIRRVARAHGLELEDLRGACRKAPVILARWEAIGALLDTFPWASQTLIGRWMHKDHTTVLHALRRLGRATAAGTVPPPPDPGAPPKPERPATPQSIISAVAKRHGVPVRAVTGADRSRPVVLARQEALVAVADAFPGMRNGEIADLFGMDPTAPAAARRAIARRQPPSSPSHAQEP